MINSSREQEPQDSTHRSGLPLSAVDKVEASFARYRMILDAFKAAERIELADLDQSLKEASQRKTHLGPKPDSIV